MPFTQFDLLPDLNKAVKAMGFTSPTPVQIQGIPPALEGKDVLGSAQTGSGKTVAFVLPLLQKLLKERHANHAHMAPSVKAVIMVPTRELAAQVETAVRDLARFSPMQCVQIIGGTSFHNQVQALKKGAEIVVATPGRLLDHYRSHTIHFRDVKVAVLDEADRMLDMGFMPDIRRIMQSLPRERQTLMFSATIPPEVQRAVGEFMKDPVRIAIDRPQSPAAGVSQMLYPVPIDQKYDLLLAILRNVQLTSGVIFVRTKARADRLSRFLMGKGIPVAVLHSNKTQAQRTQAMEGFRGQKHQILVATDIAARGIDVRHISHVINFDVPQHPEDYVHRIGRTGRNFTVGDAITLMSIDEQPFVTAIEAFIGQTIPRAALPDFGYRVAPVLQAYKPAATHHFRLRRNIARSSGHRFRR
ncbi:MAG: DEAD/DEAH box helicase [Elusimicrobia bacterium]|nr:DEAD/DEAH box helicase [Elusimicrobiota bacterium]